MLALFGHLEQIPAAAVDWTGVSVRNAAGLSSTLRNHMADALLFRRIATVETDVPVGTVDDWEWKGPREDFADVAERLGAPALAERARKLAARRSS